MSKTASRLSRRIFRRLFEHLGIDLRIHLKRLIFRSAGILAVLLVVTNGRNIDSGYLFPCVHVRLALGRAMRANGLVRFFHDVAVLWIDKPANRGPGGIHINDARLDSSHLLCSCGMKKYVWIP